MMTWDSILGDQTDFAQSTHARRAVYLGYELVHVHDVLYSYDF
jgi:hypothetical protein